MNTQLRKLIALFLAGITLCFPQMVAAHDVDASWKLTDSKLEVEVYFSDDSPMRGAAIRLIGSDQNVIQEGKTNEAGRWTCPRPDAGHYSLVINDGAGHRLEKSIVVPAMNGILSIDSGSQSREEFTRFPWIKVLIGLATIAALAVAWKMSRRSD